jgi:hypothetical protein
MARRAIAARAWPALTTPRITHILYSSFSIPPLVCFPLSPPNSRFFLRLAKKLFFLAVKNVAHLVTDEIRRAFWTEGMAWRLKERAEKQNKWRRHVAS